MNHITKIRKYQSTQRQLRGIIAAVAIKTGYTQATVSRTFHGLFVEPNPVIVNALNEWLEQHNLSSTSNGGEAA